MSLKKIYPFFLVLVLVGVDVLYWYGESKNIEIITDLVLLWSVIGFLGFVLLYLFNKTEVKYKILFNILVTIGWLVNFSIVVIWYLFKDIGF